MAKSILTSLDLQSLPALDTPRNGSINFAAKSDGLYQKIGTNEEKLLTTNESSYIPLVIGTQTATTASWTGVLDLDSLKSGQTIRYWLPRTSASSVTLNLTLKDGTTTGAINCYYGGTTRLTTHYPAGSFIMMTYLEGALINGVAYTGWWAKANYVDGTESYTVRWNAAIKAGAEITQYKLLVQGSDGRYYPTTIGNTTAGTKTISTVPFLIGSPIIFYLYTPTIAAGGVTSSSYNYTGVTTSTTTYAWNQNSGWRANEDVYLKGTVSGALFTLDNTTLTSHMTQDLPTSEDGFYYMRLGMFTNTTTGFRLSLQHSVYYFADGELQSLNTSNGADWNDIRNLPSTFTPSSHSHPTTDITGLGNIATINKNNSTANYLRGDGTWVTPPNTTYSTATTSANGLMSSADKSKLDGIASNANNYSLPTASATVLGGVKIGSNISISSGVISVAAPYTHPTTHPATIIAQTSSYRFVTDTEKSTWNAKSDLALGTTSTTAYRGDRGVIAYNHSQSAHDYLPLSGGTLIGNLTAPTIETLTSITTPKVIFKTAGWSMEQSIEGVLELKYNGVIKQKFLNDGSIAATGELTSYVAGASGYSEFLPLSGGTLTGNLNISTGVIIGTVGIPLFVRGSAFRYNNSDVLYKGNIGTASLPSIGLSDGWTIEIQTTPSSALLIKKDGVIKGTFNA